MLLFRPCPPGNHHHGFRLWGLWLQRSSYGARSLATFMDCRSLWPVGCCCCCMLHTAAACCMLPFGTIDDLASPSLRYATLTLQAEVKSGGRVPEKGKLLTLRSTPATADFDLKRDVRGNRIVSLPLSLSLSWRRAFSFCPRSQQQDSWSRVAVFMLWW